MQPSFKFKTTIFLVTVSLLCFTQTEPQGGRIVNQDVAQDSEEQFVDDPQGRREDQWWNNYEAIEEQAKTYDDQLEMIYMYKFNPLDFTTTTKLKTPRPTTPETFANAVTSPTSTFNRETQVSRNRPKPQQPKIETPKPIFKQPEEVTIHFESESPIQTSPQPQLPITHAVPLRKHKPVFKVSTEPEIPVTQAPLATPIAANPQQAFTQRTVAFQPSSQTFRPLAQPIQPQSQTFRPQNQNFQPRPPNVPLQAQNVQLNFQSRPQNPRPQPQPLSFQPPQQNFKPLAPNILPQQQNIRPQSQNFQSQPQNIQPLLPNSQNQPPNFQPQNSRAHPQNFQQRPQFQNTQLNDQPPTTSNSLQASEETVQPIVSTPSSPAAAPRLPLQFVPGKTSPFGLPKLPFDFRSIPNAIPLPAYLFQKPAKPIATTPQTPPNRGSSKFGATTVSPETITNTEFTNFPGDLTTRNSKLRVRVRRPTTLTPEKPDLEDKALFDVVVPKKSGGRNLNKNNVNLLTNIESEGSVALSAAPSSNEPQRVSPTQTTAPRRGGRRGSPHGLPTTPTASPNSVNHPFLESTTPSAAQSDNLPRYVRLLNRYSLLESNQSAPDRKRIQNRQVNLTQVEQHPPSARLFNGDVTTTRNQRRRRPTSSSSTQIPSAHTDSIPSDSIEVASFQRSNSRTQRRQPSNTESTTVFVTSTTNSPTTSRTDRSRRRFSTEAPNLSATTTTPGVAVTTAASTTSTISRRPLKRGRGFAFHQTSSSTRKPESIETTENSKTAESNDNLEQNGLVTDELKNKQENNSIISSEEKSEQVVPTPEIAESDDQVQANGLRKRKINFKRKPSSSSFRLNSPVINKPNLIGKRENGAAANKSLVADNQAQSSSFSSSKFKPKSALRPSVSGSSGSKFKPKPNSSTTTSPVVSTTKRRTFRFQPKFKKQSDVTEEPSTTVESFLNSNDTTESIEEIEDPTTTTESIVQSRVKPGRGSLFARPSLTSSKRSTTRSPIQSRVTTVSPLKTTSQIATTTKKSFKSRFRTTTTTTEKPITETPTTKKELDIKSVADEALLQADSTPKLKVESLPTTVSPIVSRQKSRFGFLARVTPSPPTATPTETTQLTTTSAALLTEAVTESADLSVKTTKRFGKRRRRPSSSSTQPDLNSSIDVTTFTPTHTFAASTFHPNAEAKILLNGNHDFIRQEAGVESSTFHHVADISEGENKTDASGLNGDKRRKVRRRKITQRSTSALSDLIGSSSVNFNTFSTTETGFNFAQTTPNQQIITSTINSLIALQQEGKLSNDSEKTKALAKKELLEKIAAKKSAQSFEQNGFTFNSDEPLVMAADDSGVWFSNPDESSLSENRSPPLSFSRSRSRRIEDPEVKTNVEKIISERRESSSGVEDDSWFSGGNAATEQVSIDRKDENIEPEEDSTTPKESASNDDKNSENKNQNKAKITQKSRTATFSVSSSTSVQSEISKRRSSSSIPGFMQKKQDEPKEVSTSTKSPRQDDDDGFRIADLGPPRVIVIDKVTMRFRESDIETTPKPLLVEEEEEEELITTTTEDELDKTTLKTEAPTVNTKEKSETEDKKEKTRTNPNQNQSPNRRNRLINMSRGSSSSPKTTTTTSTEASTTTESDLHQEKTTEAPSEVEAAYKNPSDEVGYFGPEEVVPEAKGALDDLNDDSQFESVGAFDDPGASLSSDDVFHDEVAAVNVSEHNDDDGHGHQSEPAPGDESSIWELSPSFNVEVLSRAPRLIQLASKRETSRSDTEFLKPMYDLLTKQRSRLPLFDDPVNQIKIPNDYEFSTSKNDFYKRFQAFQYDKSLDDLLTTSSLVDDMEPLYEDKSENLTDVPLPVTAKPSANSKNEEISLHRPTNCSRSDRNVCPLNDDYPRLLVERVIKENEKSLRDLWEKLEADRNPSQIYPEDNEEDSSKHDLSVCDSTVETFRPGWARNAKNDKWMVIINSPAFPQFVRVELCLRLKKECLFISPYYRSSCTEHHSAHRLVAIDPMNPSAGPVISIFKFPCGCSCKVEMFHGRN